MKCCMRWILGASLVFLASVRFQREQSTPEPTLPSLVASAAQARGLRPALALALVSIESSWDVHATRYEPRLSARGRTAATSHGLFQIMGSWAGSPLCPGISPSDLLSPQANISCGLAILSSAINTGGSVYRGLLLYNGGPFCLSHRCPSAQRYATQILTLADRIDR